jgi:hypothetical protein
MNQVLPNILLYHPSRLHLRGLNVDVRASTALVALSRDNLVVVRAKVEAVARPSVEVVLHVDRAADTLILTNRPVLAEGPGAVDGRLVGPGGDEDVVVAAIGGVAAQILSARAGVVCSEVLNLAPVSSWFVQYSMVDAYHVVLDQGVASPAVDGEIAVTLRLE